MFGVCINYDENDSNQEGREEDHIGYGFADVEDSSSNIQFDGFHKLCLPTGRLSSQIGAFLLSISAAEQKKQRISEIKTGLDEAEALIRKMDLEARSLQPSVKAILLAKLREYKSDLNNLKSESKRISSAKVGQAARDELLESGMADTLMLHGVDDNIGKSRKILTAMSRRMSRNKWIIGFIIAVLVVAIPLILYFKLFH
ncbi:vesicle transport v-SNARE 13 [Amborella trichopoda]|uniref:vesicle transport v-SNARE 13 n=1 Tax=Amborella trichopoda TaxID=13333 RepID=UPI0009C0B354|nr:vesicle transport v-SNARE 13 [Amborella trichopoda]|eukprot:XP_020530946.1 vesicle transport v-SNARE 13 [Amborella trichopoda]